MKNKPEAEREPEKVMGHEWTRTSRGCCSCGAFCEAPHTNCKEWHAAHVAQLSAQVAQGEPKICSSQQAAPPIKGHEWQSQYLRGQCSCGENGNGRGISHAEWQQHISSLPAAPPAPEQPVAEREPPYTPTMDEAYRFIKSNPVTSAEILAEVLGEKWTEERHAPAPPEQRQGGANS